MMSQTEALMEALKAQVDQSPDQNAVVSHDSKQAASPNGRSGVNQ
jgi:hypothetical protein